MPERARTETMKLYVARHGDALHPAVDPARPLSDLGRSDVEAVAASARERGFTVERIVHSGKTRAAETAEILGRAMGPAVELELDPGLTPNADPVRVAREAAGWDRSTLLVGHLPHVERLASILLRGRDGDGSVGFATATLVAFERDPDGSWELREVLRP